MFHTQFLEIATEKVITLVFSSAYKKVSHLTHSCSLPESKFPTKAEEDKAENFTFLQLMFLLDKF